MAISKNRIIVCVCVLLLVVVVIFFRGYDLRAEEEYNTIGKQQQQQLEVCVCVIQQHQQTVLLTGI